MTHIDTNRATLEALARRCAYADGPDRELDAEIAEAIERKSGVSLDRVGEPLPYTASIDTAVSLLPDGWYWLRPEVDLIIIEKIIGNDGSKCHISACAPKCATNPALGICAAALRARAAQFREIAAMFGAVSAAAKLNCDGK